MKQSNYVKYSNESSDWNHSITLSLINNQNLVTEAVISNDERCFKKKIL